MKNVTTYEEVLKAIIYVCKLWYRSLLTETPFELIDKYVETPVEAQRRECLPIEVDSRNVL